MLYLCRRVITRPWLLELALLVLLQRILNTFSHVYLLYGIVVLSLYFNDNYGCQYCKYNREVTQAYLSTHTDDAADDNPSDRLVSYIVGLFVNLVCFSMVSLSTPMTLDDE